MSFWLGNETLKISSKLFIENRNRLVDAVRKVAPKSTVIVLEGGVEKNRYNTDSMDLPFRQVFIIAILFIIYKFNN